VPPRRYGEKELQNSSDNTKPRAPATMRMIPTVLMLNPDAVTSTAKVRTAPTTSRKMLTPRLKLLASSTMLDHTVLCAADTVLGSKRRIDERSGSRAEGVDRHPNPTRHNPEHGQGNAGAAGPRLRPPAA
jgi:hypothetical protein